LPANLVVAIATKYCQRHFLLQSYLQPSADPGSQFNDECATMSAQPNFFTVWIHNSTLKRKAASEKKAQ